MLTKAVRRHFSNGGIPKFTTEQELRTALIKSGFIHARQTGFNDQCLVEACRDFGYPSVSSPFLTFLQVTSSIVRGGPIEVVNFAMHSWLS
jgi:hypothetical protein